MHKSNTITNLLYSWDNEKENPMNESKIYRNSCDSPNCGESIQVPQAMFLHSAHTTAIYLTKLFGFYYLTLILGGEKIQYIYKCRSNDTVKILESYIYIYI